MEAGDKYEAIVITLIRDKLDGRRVDGRAGPAWREVVNWAYILKTANSFDILDTGVRETGVKDDFLRVSA